MTAKPDPPRGGRPHIENRQPCRRTRRQSQDRPLRRPPERERDRGATTKMWRGSSFKKLELWHEWTPGALRLQTNLSRIPSGRKGGNHALIYACTDHLTLEPMFGNLTLSDEGNR